MISEMKYPLLILLYIRLLPTKKKLYEYLRPER